MARSEGFYEQVPLSDSQIRLLKLRPDAPDSLLFGDLEIFEFPYKETVPLRRPDYEALSYYWGPKALPGTEPLIYVLAGNNLYPVQIRPNLERALKRLRLTNEDRWLWVDALCIYQKKHNQFATKEKNLQLPIMHEIYNRAKRVCVWLGPEEGQSSSAMKFVRSINTLDDFHQFMKDDSREAEDLANFAQLLRRPWFNRRWIVQEIATARDAQIYCGPEELPWRDFAQAVSLFASRVTDVKRKFRASAKYGHSPDYLGDIREYSAYQLVYADTNFFRKTEKGEILEQLQSLEQVVSVLAAFEGYDPRDVVYAVIALSGDVKARTREKSEFMIDEDKEDDTFRKHLATFRPQSPSMLEKVEKTPIVAGNEKYLDPQTANVREAWKKANRLLMKPLTTSITIKTDAEVFEVYKDFLEVAVNNSQSFDILCRPWAADVRDEELPSWIQCQSKATHSLRKNRAYRRVKGDLFVGSPRSGGKIYEASGHHSIARWRYQDSPELKEKQLSRSLIAEGYILDEIKQKFLPAMGAQIPLDWFDAYTGEAAANNPADAFWRTLVGDRGAQGRKPLPQYFQTAFEYLKKQIPPYGVLDVNEVIQEEDFPPEVKEFVERVHAVVCMRRFVITKGNRIGLVPFETKKTDKIAIINGCSVPVVLRQVKLVQPLVQGITHTTTPEAAEEDEVSVRERQAGDVSPQPKEVLKDVNQPPATGMAKNSTPPFSPQSQAPGTTTPAHTKDLHTLASADNPLVKVTSHETRESDAHGGGAEVFQPGLSSYESNEAPGPDGISGQSQRPSGPAGSRPNPLPSKTSTAQVVVTIPRRGSNAHSRRGSTTSRSRTSTDSYLIPDRYYRFVGECYIHGVMEGEGARSGDTKLWLR